MAQNVRQQLRLQRWHINVCMARPLGSGGAADRNGSLRRAARRCPIGPLYVFAMDVPVGAHHGLRVLVKAAIDQAWPEAAQKVINLAQAAVAAIRIAFGASCWRSTLPRRRSTSTFQGFAFIPYEAVIQAGIRLMPG